MVLANELRELLRRDGRFVDAEGKPLKNKIVEHALKLDKELIKLLLNNEQIKRHFFKDIDGVLIFDKEKFMKFVDNKEFLPDSYTAFKNKIGLANEEGKYLAKSKEVVLVWPYKDCVLEGGQEKPDEKRKEIFHNVILAPDEIDRLLDPKVFTNFKRIDKDGEHPLDGFRRDPEINRKRGLPEDTITDNLIIKGNNLLVLHSLLKEFRGKVKLIYIDPPYNTGNDEFKYNDNFKHSTWLTFMKNRLEVAKELLKEDGVIFVQIDHKEMHYLKVLMDEIFGRYNYIATLIVKMRHPRRILVGDKDIHDITEYVLFYSKTKIFRPKKQIISKDISHYVYEIIEKSKGREIVIGGKKVVIFKKGEYEIKRHNKPSKDYLRKENIRESIMDRNSTTRFYRDFLKDRLNIDGFGTLYKVIGIGADTLGYRYIIQPREGYKNANYFQGFPILKENSFEIPKPNFIDISDIIARGSLAAEGGVKLPKGKKPEKLILELFDYVNLSENDIVLDFFAGSGTTCAVAHKNKLQYICIEQLNYGENSPWIRLKNVINGDQTGVSKDVGWQGGGDFVYMEIMKLNEAFVEKIRDAETTDELLNIWEDMKQNGFLSYRVDPRLFDKNIEEFKALSLSEQKKLLLEMLEYNDLYVNYSEIDDTTYGVSEEDKKLNKEFYEGGQDA